MIMLQFSFSNPKVIPQNVKHCNYESTKERASRKNRNSDGRTVLEPTEMCSLADFLNEMDTARYEIVDSLQRRRLSTNMKPYHMVRFLFVRQEFVETLSDEFLAMREAIRSDLQLICTNALWRVRAFLNPFYRDNVEMPGQKMVSINLEARQPLFHADGQPITVWDKDENGEHIGIAPLPIKAAHYLKISNNGIQLMPA